MIFLEVLVGGGRGGGGGGVWGGSSAKLKHLVGGCVWEIQDTPHIWRDVVFLRFENFFHTKDLQKRPTKREREWETDKTVVFSDVRNEIYMM